MKNINRRKFLSNSLLAAASLSLPIPLISKTEANSSSSMISAGSTPEIIDTNINLFEWPFRNLKYSRTNALVTKLGKHRITQAWAGSFEALFHKNIDGVNARLTEECRGNGNGMLLPFGTVNIAWPDWEEDLRRCHEVYHMPGIRLYPGYQTFDLDHPEFPQLVRQAAERKMIIQIVGNMEDSRVHHPIVHVRDMKVEPLIDIMKQVPEAKVQLLYWNHKVGRNQLEKLILETKVSLDISRIEGSGSVGRLIEGDPWNGPAMPVPAERLFFGSHAPYFPIEANVIKLFESPLALDQMQAIMNGNARQLLNKV
ncbi:MAG: hypothetical protein WD038_07090 [Balneolales bacterium]